MRFEVVVSKGLNAECIMLLIGVVRTYGSEESFSIDVLSLAEKFLSTKNTVIKLFQSLRQSGYVLTEEAFNSRGRGKNIYTFTQDFRDELEKDSFIKNACENDNPAIDILFKNKVVIKKSCGVDSKIMLRSSNRLFLLIFILHADEFGVVSNLSIADISKLMGGISRDRFKSQLKALYDIGVIKCHVSGVTGKELFGKVKGKYYLNLTHQLFECKKTETSLLRLNFNIILDGIASTEITALHLLYRSLFDFNGNYTYIGSLERFNYSTLIAESIKKVEIKKILPLFKSKALHDQLQLHLLENASEMLSNNWEVLEGGESARVITDSAWLKIVPLTKRENFEGVNSIYSDFRPFINSLSIRIAQKYKSLMLYFFGDDFNPSKVALVPHGKYGCFTRCIEIVYNDSNKGKITDVLIDNKGLVTINDSDKKSKAESLIAIKEIDKILLSHESS